jgi:hypothetical protein
MAEFHWVSVSRLRIGSGFWVTIKHYETKLSVAQRLSGCKGTQKQEKLLGQFL